MEELLKSFMSQMNQQFALLSKEIVELKESVNRIEGRMVKQNASEFRSHFVKIETELEQHRDIEFLSAKTGIHDTKINNIEKRFEV
jgi:hypothetical protein